MGHRSAVAHGFLLFGLLATSIVNGTVANGQVLQHGDWPQFRGKSASGVADGMHPPIEWDLESNHNLLWKARIPGLAHACPIVAGNRIFVVTAISDDEEQELKVGLYGAIKSVPKEAEHDWRLICLEKRNGRILWERSLHYGKPIFKRHTKATHANSTPATDGYHVVTFLASEGLYCHNIHGELLWKKDLGKLDSGYYWLKGAQWGFASSPIIFENMVILQCDIQRKKSFLTAMDISTGHEIWRTKRTDVPTWSTPTIHEGRKTQLIVNGYKHSGGYNPWTGDPLWKIDGGGDIPVPTPVVADDLIILSSAHGRQNPLRAFDVAVGHGDVGAEVLEEEDVEDFQVWNNKRDGIYMQTPLVYGDLLYACQDSGVLSCYDLKTGERHYRKRLGGNGFTASPVAADGRIYFTSEEGDVFVVRAGKEYELLAKNVIDEICMATPAIAEGMLLVRSKDHLFALGEQASASNELVSYEQPITTATSNELALTSALTDTRSDPTIVIPIGHSGNHNHQSALGCRKTTCRMTNCRARRQQRRCKRKS